MTQGLRIFDMHVWGSVRTYVMFRFYLNRRFSLPGCFKFVSDEKGKFSKQIIIKRSVGIC